MQFKRPAIAALMAIALPMFLAACEGSDGTDGRDGAAGAAGPTGPSGGDGANALVVQTAVPAGNAHCPNGGIRIDSGTDDDADDVLDAGEIDDTSYVCKSPTANNFNRIATYPVCLQLDPTCDTDDETVAEIVAATPDGRYLVYTDAPMNAIGLVDITDPTSPEGDGTVDIGGEPTSVVVSDDYIIAGVNTSPDFVSPSGELAVIGIDSGLIEATIALGGQPDSLAISPDGAYLAVVIENERDEDLGDGAPPQLPAGTLQIVELDGAPNTWTPAAVDLTGIADLFPTDPEPEYVDINDGNIAVVTLQENNHLVLVDVETAAVVDDFSAGFVDLSDVDATEEDPAVVSQTEALFGVPREPDGVAWINEELFATADEGDLDGGSRGFTVFNTRGDVVFTSGNTLDHLAAALGHYPDDRSENKGNEPENVEYGNYDGDRFLVVASERSSLLFVYDMADPVNPDLKQVLPTAAGPEGILAIPSRNLLVAASEEDDRGDKLRGGLNIYRYGNADPAYPTIRSVDRASGTPIPWGAMSGLAADLNDPDRLYAVEDSFYGSNRIFGIDVGTVPATLDAEITIVDANDVFAATTTVDLADPNVADDDATRVDVFDEADLAAMINADKSVNIDPEGVAAASGGGFWVASEGSGTVGDATRPVNSLNFVFKTDANGTIENVFTLPQALNDVQLRFGFEGVAEYGGSAYVAFQRVWPGDTNVRIGILDPTTGSWSFLFYPLEAPASQNGGWVGLSDITALGNGEFLVVERDNQGGPDAVIKRLYRFDVTGLAADSVVAKSLVRDLTDDLTATGGLQVEKVEGSAVTLMGDVFVINDNDGVDDNSGETRLVNLGNIL
ncbi:MAG: esterase-like activity of phytase family protein [Proteobacteria bacterium]|nr:esterase-like activity of phytase family protein [Pseudomonadota bacterium]